MYSTTGTGDTILCEPSEAERGLENKKTVWVMDILSAGVSVGWSARRRSGGRRGGRRGGVSRVGRCFGARAGSGSWLGALSGRGRSRSGGRRFVRRRAVVVAVVILIVVIFVTVIAILHFIVALSKQSVRGQSRGGIGTWATVRLAVVLEGLALLQGEAAIIEELGVALVLATESKVAGLIICV